MKKLVLVLLVILLRIQVYGQTCTSCSVNITSNDTSTYVINSGETLCIDSLGNFYGTLTINGGTVCNSGFFRPAVLIFNSGTINNYNNVLVNSNLSLPANSSLNNSGGAIFNIKGSLNMNGGSLVNDGILNVDQSISDNGNVTNSNIINCYQIGSGVNVVNNGAINTN